ncbi:MAG TPA: BON domain-containing protein [Chloroflexia bacterium]|nr:BON domain-containing protein [Chloroflexia bacterium]
MAEHDIELARRVRDIVAVVADDIDNVTFDVEDGVVYIEGVVPSEEQRRAISSAVSHLDGLDRVVTCLATEHVLPTPTEVDKSTLCPPQLYMHYYSH